MPGLIELLTQFRDMKNRVVTTGYHYNSPEDFILQNGTVYRYSRLPYHIRMGAPKSCFGNALILAVTEGYKYMEGYGLIKTVNLPIHHAWNVDGQGRIVDNTWSSDLPIEYMGVEFSIGRADYYTWEMDATILDCPGDNFSLYKNRWVSEDFSIRWPESCALAAIKAITVRR